MTVEEYRRRILGETKEEQAKKAKSRAQGKKAKEAGDSFETTLEYYHAQLFAQGKAIVRKTYPKTIFTGQGEARVAGRAICDYVAAIGKKAVWFEAKSTANKSVFSSPAKTLHQKKTLQDLRRIGGVGFYLVYWSTFDKCTIHEPTFDDRRIALEDGHGIISCYWLEALEAWGWI